MDLWLKILLVILVPFSIVVVSAVYKLLTMHKDLEEKEELVLSKEFICDLIFKLNKQYSEELDLRESLDFLVSQLIDSVSITSISFLIPVMERSTDYVFKTHVVYEVSERFVQSDLESLRDYVKNKLNSEITNIERNIEGGPLNSSSEAHALSRLIFPLEIGGVKGALCISSRKENHFSDSLKSSFEYLVDALSESLGMIWEVALRERRKFKAMVDSMRDGVFMVDEEYNFLIINPALREFLGLHPSGALNIVKVSSFFAPYFSFEDVISEVFIMGEVKNIDIHAQSSGDSDSSDKYYNFVAIPVKRDNVVVGVVCLLEDRTHAKELEQLRRDFSAMIIHELRSPLSVIRGTSDFILKEDANLEASQRQEFLEQIKGSSSTLLSLVNNLLDSAKIESGQIELFKQPTDVNNLVKSAAKFYETSFSQKNVSLKLDLASSIPEMEVDPEKVRQVLDNLLSNALKYTPEGGEVTAITDIHKGNLRIYIEDTGRGVKDNLKEGIFDKYKRMEGSNSSEKGTGLGLTISKGIVEAHEGKIWVEDNKPQGSRFILELPF